jgi:hypothetical protein
MHAMVVAGVEVPGLLGARTITAVPGSCGSLGAIVCEGTRRFLVAVCCCEQSGHLADGYEARRGRGFA